MIDLDKAVLYFGIAAVVAAATFNNVYAHAAQPQAVPAVVSGVLGNGAAAARSLDDEAGLSPARASCRSVSSPRC